MPETTSRVSESTRIAISRPAPRPSRRRPAWSPPCARWAASASASSARPSTSLVPSSRTTNGTDGLIWSNASIRPSRHLVAARDPAEDVEQHGGDLLVGEDHLDRARDRLGLRAAAGVEEVRRPPARLGDHVERRHDQPGAVAEDADVAVELHVGEPALLRHALLRVLRRGVAQRGDVRVAVEGVVVDRDLGVERDHLARLGHQQRVDLDERGVLGARRPRRACPASRRRGGSRRRRSPPRRRAGARGSPGSRSAGRRAACASPRGPLGHLLHVHAAHAREHRHRLLG